MALIFDYFEFLFLSDNYKFNEYYLFNLILCSFDKFE